MGTVLYGIPLYGPPIVKGKGMGMTKVDRRADTSYADQPMLDRRTPVISVGIIDKAIGKLTWISAGEKAARKKLLLGVKPIDCFNLLLNRYLFLIDDQRG